MNIFLFFKRKFNEFDLASISVYTHILSIAFLFCEFHVFLQFTLFGVLKQIVVLIGYGASAFDISRDIATEAKEVHIATRSPDVKMGKLENHKNIWEHKMVRCCL